MKPSILIKMVLSTVWTVANPVIGYYLVRYGHAHEWDVLFLPIIFWLALVFVCFSSLLWFIAFIKFFLLPIIKRADKEVEEVKGWI